MKIRLFQGLIVTIFPLHLEGIAFACLGSFRCVWSSFESSDFSETKIFVNDDYHFVM